MLRSMALIWVLELLYQARLEDNEVYISAGILRGSVRMIMLPIPVRTGMYVLSNLLVCSLMFTTKSEHCHVERCDG